MEPDSTTPNCAHDQVRQQLDRILGDPLFRNTQRLRVLLRFIVEATLAGRGDSLKEVVIGSEAYGLGPDFDPQTDNLVRVNAARLRSKLAEYYLNSGPRDPIVIALPKGA